MTYPLGVPLVALYMQSVRVYKCFGGLSIGVAVLGLQSAPLVWVQHAPVAVLGESTRSRIGFRRLDPAGESAPWAYPDWYSPITDRMVHRDGFDRLGPSHVLVHQANPTSAAPREAHA